MAQWAQAQNLPGVREIYGAHFPLEIRHFFASWLEMQPWNMINEADERQRDQAQRLVDVLASLMKAKIEELQSGPNDMFLLRLRLEEVIQGFEKRYARDPMGIVRVIKACLKKEKAILQDGTMNPPANHVQDKTVLELGSMHKKIEHAEMQLKNLQQQQEFFVIQYQELCKVQAALQNQKVETPTTETLAGAAEQKKKLDGIKHKKIQLEKLLSEEGSKILQTRETLGEFYQDCLNSLMVIQSSFLDEKLEKWKGLQRLGMINEDEQALQLDALQPVCEGLVENLWMIRQQLRQLNALQEQLFLKPDEPDTTLPLNTRLMNQCTQLLRTLITSSFVLEKQPPQVLKTQTKFATTARLLLGGKLSIYMSPPEVKASIISQPQAKSLVSWHNDLVNSVPQASQMLESLANVSGTLLNEKKVFEYTKENSALKAGFKNLSLKKIKRRDTKSDEMVTEEKFGLVLHCFFTVGDMNFCVYALSNPVVVIVHGNQYANAVATILWDNFFREKNREPFNVPESVPWSVASMGLSNHFAIMNSAPLKESDLEFLRFKVVGPHTSPSEGKLTWSFFNRETLPQRPFTFWEWYYGIGELVKKHVLMPWCDGLIVGFVSKKDAEAMLLNMTTGTFLLRFSDSEIGGISVAWVGDDRQAGKKVWHLQPWFSKDLMIRSLADRLSDLTQLTLLYPNCPKDEAFGKYYSQRGMGSANQDYVKTSIAATVLMESMKISKRKLDVALSREEQEAHELYVESEMSTSPGHEATEFLSSVADHDAQMMEFASPGQGTDEMQADQIDLKEFLMSLSKGENRDFDFQL